MNIPEIQWDCMEISALGAFYRIACFLILRSRKLRALGLGNARELGLKLEVWRLLFILITFPPLSMVVNSADHFRLST